MIKEIAELRKPEVNSPETSDIKDIKLQSETTFQKCNSFWNKLFSTDVSDIKETNYFNSYEERFGHTPKKDSDSGTWEGERAESKFIPSENTVDGKEALEKLAEYGLDGIEYHNAEPAFSKCAEATVEIGHMTEWRSNHIDIDGSQIIGNYSQADIKCAEKWSKEKKDGRTDWTPRNVYDWRHDHKYSWHERCDKKTMDLVPYTIHHQCIHLGGVSECMVRDSIGVGDDFDE